MTFRKFILAALIVSATSVAANAVTLTAKWDPVPTFVQSGGATEPVGRVAALSITDKKGGGVDVTLTNTSAFDDIGSIFLQGFSASQFTGPGTIFDASRGNRYRRDLGGSGVVFGIMTKAGNFVTRYTSVAGSGLRASDFMGDVVGTITVRPNTFSLSLFGGTMVRDITAVPVPASGLLLLSGLIGVARIKRRKV